MKILVVGDWHSDLHEEEVFRSLSRLGHDVHSFKWCNYFAISDKGSRWLNFLVKRLQNKYILGPIVNTMNRDFVSRVLSLEPDVIFVYRGTHIFEESLQILKRRLPHCFLIGYNNDNPFAPLQPNYLWRHFVAAIPTYDLVLAYRHSNLMEFRNAGAKRAELLRSWFVPDRNYPVELCAQDRRKYDCDVVFVGHYEPDQRIKFLEEIARQGFHLRIYGPRRGWFEAMSRSKVLREYPSVRMVWGEEYNKVICGAKVALCFLSKLNRDTYTRRCFEIPAARTLLLSEYTQDLAELYIEGQEADYFRSKDELISKLRHYLGNPEHRSRVAHAGYKKAFSGGHDVDSRLTDMLSMISSMKGGKRRIDHDI